jgi:hypothetical protein
MTTMTTTTMMTTTMMTMTTKKRRGSLRFPGTRLSLVAGSVVALLAIWVQVARTADRPLAGADATDAVAYAAAPVQAFPVTVGPPSNPAAAGPATAAPMPSVVPVRSVSRGS